MQRYSSSSDLSCFLENLDCYVVLRIIAENPENEECELQWRFEDIIDNGWISRNDIIHHKYPTDKKILIVTEGSSDSYIIKNTIEALYPSIYNSFDFIDMESNYPFTGVGNLYNFCQSLAKINIMNNVLVIFDNDTAGSEKFELSQKLLKPSNLHICKLPSHKEFSRFETVGPNGSSISDINGKAVSIECFLDFMDINPIVIDYLISEWINR